MRRIYCAGSLALIILFSAAGEISAQKAKLSPTLAEEVVEATASSTVIEKTPEPTPQPREDITKETPSTVEPLIRLLEEQSIGSIFPWNPLKYAIRGAIAAGVPPNTLVLLLLLPGVTTLIAGTRHLIGLRGFGIFLPASLSVVFIAMGPVTGIGLFLIIVFISTVSRILMRRMKVKLQYLPRMSLMLLFVVMGILAVLFSAPILRRPEIANVSIFPVLILVLLAEDFSKVQLGKSANVAINLTTETLILSLGSYIFLTLKFVQEFVLLNPEAWILTLLILNILLGKYVGLRLMEIVRFRRLITS